MSARHKAVRNLHRGNAKKHCHEHFIHQKFQVNPPYAHMQQLPIALWPEIRPHQRQHDPRNQRHRKLANKLTTLPPAALPLSSVPAMSGSLGKIQNRSRYTPRPPRIAAVYRTRKLFNRRIPVGNCGLVSQNRAKDVTTSEIIGLTSLRPWRCSGCADDFELAGLFHVAEDGTGGTNLRHRSPDIGLRDGHDELGVFRRSFTGDTGHFIHGRAQRLDDGREVA